MKPVFDLQRFAGEDLFKEVVKVVSENLDQINSEPGSVIDKNKIEELASSIETPEKSLKLGSITIPTTRGEILALIIELAGEVANSDSQWVKTRNSIIIVLLIMAYVKVK